MNTFLSPREIPIEEWPRAHEANQIDMLAYLGASPLATSHFSDSLSWVITGVYDNTWNGVVHTRLGTQTADAAIMEIRERFRSCVVPVPADWFPDGRVGPESGPVPYQWYLPAGSQPEDMAQRLEAQGCRRMDGGIGMGISLKPLRGEECSIPGLEIRPVRDSTDLGRWCGVVESDPASRRRREAIHGSLGLGPDTPYGRFLALIDGEPVGASGLFQGKDVVGIYEVRVLPEFERRGIGTAVILAALHEARERGYTVAVLGPSPEGMGMYRRIGFQTYPYPGVSY